MSTDKEFFQGLRDYYKERNNQRIDEYYSKKLKYESHPTQENNEEYQKERMELIKLLGESAVEYIDLKGLAPLKVIK
ncbi:hypothetical protein [Methanobacterium paludis]|uniref:Uncharacterized protein n=1 Tax=Methanobacterium paludis (strain DSM 25820 / JCM 18151 / SWAN1) TaxID=868131 RepID=F6D2S1_METPW|nr:hypothetical protein [Methanobacterium paludis]AEG18650.1 hypothetical protein MSWAN_1639 [Methanobacterium paludis]